MADIVLSSAGKIFSIGQAIKRAVATDRRNKEEYQGIVTCVNRVYSILWCLRENTQLSQHLVMSAALVDLGNSLEEALDLIHDFQGRNGFTRLLKAGDTANELRRVKEDIDHNLLVGMFAGMMQIFTLTATVQDPQGLRVLVVAHWVMKLREDILSIDELLLSTELQKTCMVQVIVEEEPIGGTDPSTNRGSSSTPTTDDDNGCHSSNSKGSEVDPPGPTSSRGIVPEGQAETLPRRLISLRIQRDARAPGQCTRPSRVHKTSLATCPPRRTKEVVPPERRPWR